MLLLNFDDWVVHFFEDGVAVPLQEPHPFNEQVVESLEQWRRPSEIAVAALTLREVSDQVCDDLRDVGLIDFLASEFALEIAGKPQLGEFLQNQVLLR